MSILSRFKDIMTSNINAWLDKAEDPEKMIDQYLRNLNRDLGKVKAETSTVMAEEQRAKRMLNECTADIEKMEKFAMKALEAGNEEDARKFLERKTQLVEKQKELQASYELAVSNANQMKQMHDKLVSDINELEAKRRMLKAKWSVAKTQQRINKIGSSVTDANNTASAFGRMEDKINRALDEANAMAELNRNPDDDLEKLAEKYEQKTSVDDELAALKAKLNKKD